MLFILFGLWIYQYIGKLHYCINHTSSEYEETRVNMPSTPRLWMFLLSKIFRGRLHWLLSTSPGGTWHYINWKDKKRIKKDVKWIIRGYWRIWSWPITEGVLIYKELKFRVLNHYHMVFRTRQKEYLCESMFSELRDIVKKRLPGFKIIGAEYFDCEYYIYLNLPGETNEFLGPWFYPNEKQRPWGRSSLKKICIFQEYASEKLNAILELPRDEKAEKTKEIVVKVGKGVFYDVNGWGFEKAKWETWKHEFISFFLDTRVIHKAHEAKR